MGVRPGTGIKTPPDVSPPPVLPQLTAERTSKCSKEAITKQYIPTAVADITGSNTVVVLIVVVE